MNVQQLASELNVTESDVTNLVNTVCISMKQDLVMEEFMEMDASEIVNTINAYIQIELKEFCEFCADLLEDEGKRKAFEFLVQSQVI